MTTKHLPIGGSTATRTLACPGWIKASEGVPRGKSSVYADEGNLLHDVMEDYYQNDIAFIDQLGRQYAEQVLTQDLIDDYLVSARWMVEEIMDKYDIDEYICEPFVEYIPGFAGGSIDMLAVSADRTTVVVLDYKFGHAPIDPATSAQLPFYALSAEEDTKTKRFFTAAETLVYVIIQPKVSNAPLVHTVPRASLVKFSGQLDEAIRLAQQKNPPKSAGAHCQYCPAAPYCEEKKSQVKSALLIPPKDAQSLSQALSLVTEMNTWIKDVEKAAHDLLEKGAQIPGFKLVQKRATRKWKNDLDAGMFMDEHNIQAFDRKLKTPAQVEKLVKKAKLDIDLDQLIEKKSSGTTVVPDSDKREAVVVPEISDSLKRIVG